MLFCTGKKPKSKGLNIKKVRIHIPATKSERARYPGDVLTKKTTKKITKGKARIEIPIKKAKTTKVKVDVLKVAKSLAGALAKVDSRKTTLAKILSKSKKNVKAPETEAEEAAPQRLQVDMQKVSSILADARIRQMLIEMGGENALAIIRNFYTNYSDEDIAKKLKLKISDVRATLNKLHNEGLVNYVREKDNETGWYSYSWSLNLPRVERWATHQANRMVQLDGNTDYYFCSGCGVASVTNLESAVVRDFKCEVCSSPLEMIEAKKMMELFERRR